MLLFLPLLATPTPRHRSGKLVHSARTGGEGGGLPPGDQDEPAEGAGTGRNTFSKEAKGKEKESRN